MAGRGRGAHAPSSTPEDSTQDTSEGSARGIRGTVSSRRGSTLRGRGSSAMRRGSSASSSLPTRPPGIIEVDDSAYSGPVDEESSIGHADGESSESDAPLRREKRPTKKIPPSRLRQESDSELSLPGTPLEDPKPIKARDQVWQEAIVAVAKPMVSDRPSVPIGTASLVSRTATPAPRTVEAGTGTPAKKPSMYRPSSCEEPHAPDKGVVVAEGLSAIARSRPERRAPPLPEATDSEPSSTLAPRAARVPPKGGLPEATDSEEKVMPSNWKGLGKKKEEAKDSPPEWPTQRGAKLKETSKTTVSESRPAMRPTPSRTSSTVSAESTGSTRSARAPEGLEALSAVPSSDVSTGKVRGTAAYIPYKSRPLTVPVDRSSAKTSSEPRKTASAGKGSDPSAGEPSDAKAPDSGRGKGATK